MSFLQDRQEGGHERARIETTETLLPQTITNINALPQHYCFKELLHVCDMRWDGRKEDKRLCVFVLVPSTTQRATVKPTARPSRVTDLHKM